MRPAVRRKITLPNAAVGRDYRAQVVFAQEPSTRIAPPCASGFDELGISFDPATCTLAGLPEKAGDFPFSFTATLHEADGTATTIALEGVLTVNPDPKTLWRDIASDPSGRFAKLDDDCASVSDEGTRVVAASRRGRSHAHEGKYRDDEFGFRRAADGWWLLAVADGAGSAPYSRRGSQVAVSEALTTLETLLPVHADSSFLDAVHQFSSGDAGAQGVMRRQLYELLVRSAYAGATAIAAVATAESEPERNFASTLLLAMYRKIGEFHFVAGFGIGDGGIALLRLEDDAVVPLSEADSGEYAGQTRFLTNAEFASAERTMKRIRFASVERFTAIVLMTDGVSDAQLESDEQFADIDRWRALWNQELAPVLSAQDGDASVEQRLLRWLDFYSPNNHDDRTLAILLPPAS